MSLANMLRLQTFLMLGTIFLSWILYTLIMWNHNSDEHDSIIMPQKLHPPDPQQPLPPSSSPLLVYEGAAICSDSTTCSNIGRDILLAGGSAVDSAVATLLCNGLKAMQSMGPGGGHLMNVYIQGEKRAYSILARERAPLAAVNESLLDASENPRLKCSRSIATPNEIMGYAVAYNKFGRLPWAALVKPTIDLCHAGYRLSKHQRDSLQTNQEMVLHDKHLRQTFMNATTVDFYSIGTHIRPPKELCDTYDLLAQKGPKDFYEGHLGKLLAMDLKELGSLVTEEDLRRVKAEIKPALRLPLGDYELHLIPPPGSGHIVGFIMKVLHQFHKDFGREERDLNAKDVHRIVEALKFGFVKRWELDVDADEKFLYNLTDPEYVAHVAHIINERGMTLDDPTYYGADPQLLCQIEHGTAHISVLAPNGDAVSATSSINFYFGSGLTGTRTGVLFNNALADFTIEGQSNYFGLPNIANRNRLKPQRSPMSSMSPVIVTDNEGSVRLVVGAAGGTKIISALVPLLVRILWMQKNIKQAIDSARFHHQLLPDVLEYEFGVIESILSSLKKRGHKTQRYRERGSAICGIEKNAHGIYVNADYRKEGGVAGF